MLRILVADTTQAIGKAIITKFGGEFEIQTCCDGDRTLDLIRTFQPEILVLDVMLPGVDGLSLLRGLRASGIGTKVIALSRVVHDYAVAQLMEQGVCCVLTKPCAMRLLFTHIRQLAFRIEHPDFTEWCVENEVDYILLSLGFRMGPNRYRCVAEGIMMRYETPDCSMKQLYIDVARICGGNYSSVEKAIRNAIENAYLNGNPALWALYFSPDSKREKAYPSNEEFIARIVGCLVQKTRIKPPVVSQYMKAN